MSEKELEIENEVAFVYAIKHGVQIALEIKDAHFQFAIAKFNYELDKENIVDAELLMQELIPDYVFKLEEIVIEPSDQLDCKKNEYEYRIFKRW